MEGMIMIQKVIVEQQNLSDLTIQERRDCYLRLCEFLSMPPDTNPFRYHEVGSGNAKKWYLMPAASLVDQLIIRKKISLTMTVRDWQDQVFSIAYRGTTEDGRTDEILVVRSVALQEPAQTAAFMEACANKSRRQVVLALSDLSLLEPVFERLFPIHEPTCEESYCFLSSKKGKKDQVPFVQMFVEKEGQEDHFFASGEELVNQITQLQPGMKLKLSFEEREKGKVITGMQVVV